MSLQDLYLQRAALENPEFRDDYGSGAPSKLFSQIADTIVKQREKLQLQKQREQELANANTQFSKYENNPNYEVTAQIDENGGIIKKATPISLSSSGKPKSIYTVDSSGKTITKVGEVESNAQVFKEFVSPELAAEKAQAIADVKRITDARKRSDEYVSEASQVLNAIKNLESVVENLPRYERGIANQAKAKADIMAKRFAKDEDINKYDITVSQVLIPFARKVMEEKGPITEFDVARVEKGLGDPTSPIEDKRFALELLKEKIGEAIQIKRQEAENPGSSLSDFENFDVIDINKKRNELYQMYGLEQ